MAHIVCITGGLTGIFHASLALVQQLQRAGHRVTYASPADLGQPVTALGIPYVQLDPWVMQLGDPPMGRWAQFRRWRERQQRAVDALGVQHFGDRMQQLAPDLLLLDLEMYPHTMAAVMAQLPVALLCQFVSVWRRPHLPPIHTKTIPGQGWAGSRLGIAWSWLCHGGTTWHTFQREKWRRMGLDWISVLDCYAKQINYPRRLRFGFRQWLMPYPNESLPILCMNGLELDFPHVPHPSMQYLGPMVSHQGPGFIDTDIDTDIDPALAQMLERPPTDEHPPTASRPLIYCGLSSFAKADQQLIKAIIAAAADSPQWDWILGLGNSLQPEELGPLPANLKAWAWAPQIHILQRADCAIITAGINSINECISCGVPMLVYSLGHADQNGNAARIAYHRLGIVEDREQNDATRVCRHIQTLLTDRSYGAHVERMKTCFLAYEQEQRAVEIVEKLLRAQPEKKPWVHGASP